jgi:hypothetical protein
MLEIKFELNGEKKQFESSLPYTMIGVSEGIPIKLFQNYKEVDDYGFKNQRSFSIIPCTFTGKPSYEKNYFLEKFDENRKEFKWAAPPKPVVVEQPKAETKPKKKLRQRRKKK